MDLTGLSPAAQESIRIIELQSVAKLQKELEGKWGYLRSRDGRSGQWNLSTSEREDFFFKPIGTYANAVLKAVATEYFKAITGIEFVTTLKDRLLPNLLKSAAEAWRLAVQNSLEATGFTFAIIPGRSGWDRNGILGIDFSSRLRAALQPAINEWEGRAKSRSLESAATPAAGSRPESDIDAVMKEGRATPPGTAPYPKRAAWFEHELALREWSIHELQGQGGPDWKTSRKILDGLSVSRGVLEKTAAALSKKKKQVFFRDVPQE